MALLIKKDKTVDSINNILKEFIDNSRSILDLKISNIVTLLKSLKEENEQNISKITSFCEKNNINLLINNNIIINQNIPTKDKKRNTYQQLNNSVDSEKNDKKVSSGFNVSDKKLYNAISVFESKGRVQNNNSKTKKERSVESTNRNTINEKKNKNKKNNDNMHKYNDKSLFASKRTFNKNTNTNNDNKANMTLNKSRYLKQVNANNINNKTLNRSINNYLNNSKNSSNMTLPYTKVKRSSPGAIKGRTENDSGNKKQKLTKKIKKSRSILLQEDIKPYQNKQTNNVNMNYNKRNSVGALQTTTLNKENNKEMLLSFDQSKIENNKKITTKNEKVYLILCKSPILRLCEQLIFSRSTPVIKESLSIDDMLRNHLCILESKEKELKNEINLCTEKIKKPFIASKIADISLNFITSADEQEFKEYDIFNMNEKDKFYYYHFIKILYLLLNEKCDSKNDKLKFKAQLFHKINLKGYKSIKDYLYYIFISKKKPTNFVSVQIEEINNVIQKVPKLLDIDESWRKCRFIGFSIYLIKEIISYANTIKDTMELQVKAQNFLVIVDEKLNKTKAKLEHNQKIKKELIH